jgi:DNA segregation ATPase FtsK/SpoIIIE, S-DNA-T family
MKATTRSAARRNRQEPDLSHRPFDIAGLLLLALAVLIVLSLVMADTGLLGLALSSAFLGLFGKGAWIVPIILSLLGVGLLAGRRSIEITQLGIGLGILFGAILGIIAAKDAYGGYFSVETVSASGGYLGAAIGWLFEKLLGAAKLVGLGALGLSGLVLCIRVPIRVLTATAAETLRERKRTRPIERERVRRERPAPENDAPEPAAATATPAAEPRKTRTAPIIRDTVQPSFETVEGAPKEGYQLPPMALLAEPIGKPKRSQQEMQENIETLESTLEEFGIDANVVK